MNENTTRAGVEYRFTYALLDGSYRSTITYTELAQALSAQQYYENDAQKRYSTTIIKRTYTDEVITPASNE